MLLNQSQINESLTQKEQSIVEKLQSVLAELESKNAELQRKLDIAIEEQRDIMTLTKEWLQWIDQMNENNRSMLWDYERKHDGKPKPCDYYFAMKLKNNADVSNYLLDDFMHEIDRSIEQHDKTHGN